MRRPLALAALAIALLPAPAAAQAKVAAPSAGARPRGDTPALRAQLGVPVAQRLLASDDFAERIRGIERLGAIGTTEAVDALVDAVDSPSVVGRDPRARLMAVRVLADEARRDNVRHLLFREVTDTSGSDGRGGVSPLAAVLRATAALALARSGDRKAVEALRDAVLQSSGTAEVVTHALRVYPPASLNALLDEHRRPSPALLTLLGEIGDLRAVGSLRAMVQEGEPAAKLAAAAALAKLGDESALPIARAWGKTSDPLQRAVGATVLVQLAAPDAPDAVAALLAGDKTREAGIRLALLAPSPALAAPLAKVLPDLPEDQRPRAVAAIGRAWGVAQLAPLLDQPDLALPAAFALAILPGSEAKRALEAALANKDAKKDARRLLVRAGVVRALVLDDAPGGLEAGLRALFSATNAADRAAGAFGLVATGALSLSDALAKTCKPGDELACDLAAASAARGALALPDGASSLEPLEPLLARAILAVDPRTAPALDAPAAAHEQHSLTEAITVAAGAALLAHPDGGGLPTSVLATWAEAGGPLSPLAARALPARDDDALRGRIKRLLQGSDPVVRAHVALGLGRDPEPSAVSLLTSAYRFEEDAAVRRAIVRALSLRTEVQRIAALSLARDLDPDDEVRALAHAALAGQDLDPTIRPALGAEPRRSIAWVSVRANDAEGERTKPAQSTARVVRADGVAVPVVADPDGALLVPGLPAGPASLQLGRVEGTGGGD